MILTDWFVNPETPGERMKVTVTILDQDLRADALRVAASRQVQQDGTVDRCAGRRRPPSQKLEDLILTQARDLRRELSARSGCRLRRPGAAGTRLT